MLTSTLLTLGGAALAFASADGGHGGDGLDLGGGRGGIDADKSGFTAKGYDSGYADAKGEDPAEGSYGSDKGFDSGKGGHGDARSSELADGGFGGSKGDEFDLFEGFSRGFFGKEGPDGFGGEWTRRVVKARE
ncbi:hypothetical protein JCM3770_001173 [Rhodotorula araucariae]